MVGSSIVPYRCVVFNCSMCLERLFFLYLFFFFIRAFSHSSHTYGNQSHSVRYSTIIKDENETQTRKMMIFHHVHTRSFLFGNQTQFIFFFFFFRFVSFLHHLFTVYSFVVRPRIYRKFEFSIAYRLWVCLRIKRSFISIEFNWIEFNSIYMQRFISSHVLLVSSSFSLLFYFIFFYIRFNFKWKSYLIHKFLRFILSRRWFELLAFLSHFKHHWIYLRIFFEEKEKSMTLSKRPRIF